MIKKLLLLFSVSTILVNAQQNLDFETWTSGVPDNWDASFNFFAPGSVSQNTADPAQGSSSVKLQTSACPFCSIFGLPSVMPGVVSQSVPFTGRPVSMTLSYRANIDAGDEALILASTNIWDTGTNSSEVVGNAYAMIPGGTSMNSWQTQTLPFTYLLPSVPDTINFNFISSDSLFGFPSVQSLNTILEIDAIVLNYSAGISEVAFMAGNFIAFPNPANNEISIVSKNASASLVKVYDVTGRLVNSVELSNGKVSIDISDLENGIYIYSILDKNNSKIHTSKFVVSK